MSEVIGRLYKNAASGRYVVDTTGRVFTCGECCDVRVDSAWVPTRVEHDGKDYCFVNTDVPMQGAEVRYSV